MFNFSLNKKKKKKLKKVLIIHRYFYPDKSSCSTIIHEIAKFISKFNYQIDVITSHPQRFSSKTKIMNYEPKSKDKINIVRLNLMRESKNPYSRIVNALYLGFWILLRSISTDYEIIISTSTPPILTAFFAAIASKFYKSRFIYYCMDINPEIGILNGDFSNIYLQRLMLFIDKWTLKEASPVVVHSVDMKNTLLSRKLYKDLDIEIINNFAVPSKDQKLLNENKIKREEKNSLKVIFAGNLGRFQGLETTIKAFALLNKYKGIKLTLLGNGSERENLLKMSSKLNANVEFIDHVSYDKAKSIIYESDIGLVSLIPNMYKYAYPSKTMAYLEQGIPVIAMIEEESELAINMKKFGYGFVTPINDSLSLSKLIFQLSENKSWKLKMKKALDQAFLEEFSCEVILEKWKKIILR